MAIKTTRIAPVAIVLPSSAMATFPPARFCAMMPEPTTVATSIKVPRNSATARRGRSNSGIDSSRLGQRLTDLVQALLEAQPIDGSKRQAGEDADAVVKQPIGFCEREASLSFLALGCGRIWYAPVRGHRLSRPDRADLVGRVVADGEYEIEMWRPCGRELIPALGAQACRRVVHPLQEIER